MKNSRHAILITAPHEDVAHHLKSHLEQHGLVACTQFDIGKKGARKKRAFGLVVTLFETDEGLAERSYRTLVISPGDHPSREFEVERDGLYTTRNLSQLSTKVARLLRELDNRQLILTEEPFANADKALVGDKGEMALADMIGKSASIKQIKNTIRQVSRNPGLPVLITGETGTGKELVVDALHACSPRAGQPLIKVNCAAIPENLFESQLFGHRKGAFSGAARDQKGWVEAAGEGTLFLDEIGSLKLEHQAKLLRFLENGSYTRVGETDGCKSGAWVISASNMELSQLVARGQFREDLYHRLVCVHFHLPPLRKRLEDMLPLADHFLRTAPGGPGGRIYGFAKEVTPQLLAYHWPGNIRELRQVISSLKTRAQTTLIDFEDLPSNIVCRRRLGKRRSKANLSLDQFEKACITKSLIRNRLNLSKTARELQIDRGTLKRKIARYNICF